MPKSWKRARRDRILRDCPVHEQLEAIMDQLAALPPGQQTDALKTQLGRIDTAKAAHPKPENG